jgi:hypothetical protein
MLAVDEEHESDGARAARRSAYAIAARHRLRRATPSQPQTRSRVSILSLAWSCIRAATGIPEVSRCSLSCADTKSACWRGRQRFPRVPAA